MDADVGLDCRGMRCPPPSIRPAESIGEGLAPDGVARFVVRRDR
jgi:hypothetical protein